MSRRADFRPASFRGVDFETRGNGKSAGRRGKHDEYPGRDQGFVQDAGKHDDEITLDAYVIGDDWIARRDALEAALLQPGKGRLVHPSRGSLDVVVKPGRWSVRERYDRQGMAVFRLAFLLADDVPQFPTSTAAQDDAVRGAAATVRAASISAAKDVLDVSGPDWIAVDAAATIATLVDEIDGVSALASGSASSNASTSAVSVGVSSDAASAETWIGGVSESGIVGSDLSSSGWKSYRSAYGSAGADAVLSALDARDLFRVAVQIYGAIETAFYSIAGDGLITLRSASGAYSAATGLLDLRAPAQDESSVSGARRAANARALYRLVRLSALTVACEAALARPYDGTDTALAVMQTLDKAVEAVIREETRTGAGYADALVRNLTDLRATTREALLGTVADIVPVISRDVPLTLPSLALSWRLKAGIESEADIVARNGFGNPMFCPAGTVQYLGGADV